MTNKPSMTLEIASALTHEATDDELALISELVENEKLERKKRLIE